MKYLYTITLLVPAPFYGEGVTTEATAHLTHRRDDLTERGIMRILRRDNDEQSPDAQISRVEIACYANG